jgi:hypothetical protein
MTAAEIRHGGEKNENEERGGKGMTCGSHVYVSSTSSKPPSKTARWLNLHGIKSWMVKDFWFWS